MSRTGNEITTGIPGPLQDPSIGELLMNLTVRVEGAAGSDYANDFLDVGLTVQKTKGVNVLNFTTSRPGEFPTDFAQILQNKLPEIIMSAVFGGMDGDMPDNLENYSHTPV